MSRFKFIDIGANLTDDMYNGVYNGRQTHENDINNVLQRAWNTGLDKIIITGVNLEGSKKGLELAKLDDRLYCTVGVHPTNSTEIRKEFSSSEEYMNKLKVLINENRDKVVAIGEFGLDYERTQFCDIPTQKQYFRLQLKELGNENLPLFLHCRAAFADLYKILSADEHKDAIKRGGVVHSFDGTEEDMEMILALGANFYIGINGCSLKTKENCDVVKKIPPEKMLLETDSPWCGVRPSHYSSNLISTKFEMSKKKYDPNMMFKSRNEPQTILNIMEIVASVKEMDEEVVVAQVYKNTMDLFFNDKEKN